MRTKLLPLLLSIPLLLTGCWDQRELKNIRMVHTAGVDLLENNEIRLSVSIPTIKTSIDSQGNVVTPKVSGQGHSVQEANNQLQKMVSQHMDLRESRVLLVNKRLAEKSLYEAMDFFFREAHFPINVYLAITDNAQDIVQLNVEDRSLISEYLYDLMVSSEQEGFIPKESPFLISSIMLTPGEDVALPFIRADKQKDRAVVDGVALFHHKKMTGMLNDRQAQTFVMMRKDKAYGTLTEAIGPQATYVTFTFERSRQSIKLTAAKEGITADIQVSLNCALMDNPSGQFITDSMIKDMEQKLEKLLTTRAEQTVSQLQKANCDGLDIGLQLKALHNSEWSKLDWDREYSKIDIHPQIHVKIDNHGLLN